MRVYQGLVDPSPVHVRGFLIGDSNPFFLRCVDLTRSTHASARAMGRDIYAMVIEVPKRDLARDKVYIHPFGAARGLVMLVPGH